LPVFAKIEPASMRIVDLFCRLSAGSRTRRSSLRSFMRKMIPELSVISQ
jgi:hypothetical protein